MGDTLSQRAEKVSTTHTVEVVRHGERLIIPSDMPYDVAIELIQRQKAYEQEEVAIAETIDAFVWDGALAMVKAAERMFGTIFAEAQKTMFGKNPPRMISIEVGYNETRLVPWGQFSLPGIEGSITTGTALKDNHVVFNLQAKVKRKYEQNIRDLVALTREIVAKESIYRGKAIRFNYTKEDGSIDPMPMPAFLNLKNVRADELILSHDVQRAVDTSLFTPIEKSALCRKYSIPLKRGILLEGAFGTGKTLCAYITAKKCQDNHWTYLYCEKAVDLAHMVGFAHKYQPCVIFCEDIDRVMSGVRDEGMDKILNIIDGIESKSAEIIVILSTNYVEAINRAMLRPGRLDAVIKFSPPDAEAVARLIALYGRGHIKTDEDLSRASRELEGKIPAVVRECVERSKLSALKLSDTIEITGEALYDAAVGMRDQLQLLAGKQDVPLTAGEHIAKGVSELVSMQLTDHMYDLAKAVAAEVVE